jgi:hypothetical protein
MSGLAMLKRGGANRLCVITHRQCHLKYSKWKIDHQIRRFVRHMSSAEGGIEMYFMLTKCIKALTLYLSLYTPEHVGQFAKSLLPLADLEHK